jgi:streptogramin lyase
VLLIASRRSPDQPSSAARTDATGGCEARGRVARDGATRFPIGGYANLLATGAGSVWTLVASGGGPDGAERLRILRIDPRTGALERHPYRGSSEARIRVGHGAVWLADPQTRVVTRMSLADGRRLTTRPFGAGAPRELAIGPGGVWAIEDARPRLVELDPETARPLRRLHVRRASELADVAVDADRVWLTDAARGSVIRMSVATGRMIGEPTPVGGTALDIELDGAHAWVDLGEADQLARVDAGGRLVARARDNGGDAFAIAVGFGSVWVTNYGLGTVTRVDAQTGRRVGPPIPVGADPKGVAVGDQAVWVATAGECSLTAIDP